ncbi:MAG: hypothetical protein MUF00_13490 [Gemmatimonadaceae bacterium]|nr:hypothetical protein [Gemmatimonadaceae bacterium]
MPIDPKVVAKWNAAQWQANVKYARPSGGGAVGVLFCFTRTSTSYPINQADFVIKPLPGSAASTQFAEHTLSKLVGATSMQSEGIARASPLGNAIVMWVEHVVDLHDLDPIDNAHPDIDRLRQFAPQLRGAGSFVVQRVAQGMQELDAAYKTVDGLDRILTNEKLMRSLGALFVADALLGNGDRLDQLNAGNNAFDSEGKLFSLDSGTVLTSFDKVLKDSTKQSWTRTDNTGALTSWHWAADILGKDNQGGVAVLTPAQRQLKQGGHAVATPPSARMTLLFTPNRIWDYFWSDLRNKVHFYNQERARNNQPLIPRPSNLAISNAKTWFTKGVHAGLAKADSMLGGVAWLQTKYKFKELRAKHGGDPNYSWTNLKIRRLIVRAAKEGKSVEQAHQLVTDYVQRKFNDFSL